MLVRYSSAKKGKPEKAALIYTKNEHNINKTLIDADALKIIAHLRDYGHDAYIVGGAVRDLLIGNVPKDFDIVTSATPVAIKKLFRNSRIIGKRFRLVHVFFTQKIFEVSTFRSLADGTTGNSFGTMEEDVQRRDFTINALYYDPHKEQLIDYVKGIQDIAAKKIKPVIPLKTIFSDDPVRMVRAIKYAVGSNFDLPFLVRRKIVKSAHFLSSVSPSRLTEELTKILNGGKAYGIVTLAQKLHIYMYLQPTASSLIQEKGSFCQSYFESLKKLDAAVKENPDVRMGYKLAFFIEAFIAELTDWKKEIEAFDALSDLYNRTWSQCRNYVLPMNPPRTELDFAVRHCLKQLGVPVKKPRPPVKARDVTKTAQANTQNAISSETEQPVLKKKRKPKRKSKTQDIIS